MRRIINGTVYDTDTAQLLIEDTDSEDPEDWIWLYRSKSGKFFEAVPDLNKGSGEIIKPLTRKGALILAFRILGNLEEAKRLIGFDDEVEGIKQISIRVSMRTYRILRETAAERGMSMGAVIEDMVENATDPSEYFLDDKYEYYLGSLSDKDLVDELEKEEREQREIQKMIKEHRNNVVTL